MPQTRLLLFACLSAFSASLAAAQQPPSTPCPPPARKSDTVDTLHGVSIPDPYRWLEDQDSAETRAWIDAENHCTNSALNAIPGRPQITKRLSELLKTDSFTKRAADPRPQPRSFDRLWRIRRKSHPRF